MKETKYRSSDFFNSQYKLDEEVKKINLWEEPRGITYEIGTDAKGGKWVMNYGTCNDDGVITRVCQMDRISPQGRHIVSRDASIFEMLRFHKVAARAFPGLLLVEIMRGDIKKKIKADKSNS